MATLHFIKYTMVNEVGDLSSGISQTKAVEFITFLHLLCKIIGLTLITSLKLGIYYMEQSSS